MSIQRGAGEAAECLWLLLYLGRYSRGGFEMPFISHYIKVF